MKTIEERAKLASEGYDDDGYSASLYMGYVVGAKEQKAIDDAECVNQVLMGNRSAINYYKQGYHDAIEKACQWITEHIDIPYEGEFIDDSPAASDYIEWCEKRLEYAKEIVNKIKQAMEEQI